MFSFLKSISTISMLWMVIMAVVVCSIVYNIFHLPEVLEQVGSAIIITHHVFDYVFPSFYLLFSFVLPTS